MTTQAAELIFKIYEGPITIERRWSWRHFKRVDCKGVWVFLMRRDTSVCCHKFFMQEKTDV